MIRRKSRFVVSSLLMLCMFVVLAGCGAAIRRSASLTAVASDVERFDGSTSRVEPVATGQSKKVYEGDAVNVNTTGYATLNILKCIIEIYRDSRLQTRGLPTESAPVCIIGFEYGTILASVSTTTIVETDWAKITTIGTKFFVHYDRERDLLWVVVSEGAVAIQTEMGHVIVEANQQVWIRRGQPPEPVVPATRSNVGRLFPPVDDLTRGFLSDPEVLRDDRSGLLVTHTPTSLPSVTATATRSLFITPTPMNTVPRPSNTPTSVFTRTPTPAPIRTPTRTPTLFAPSVRGPQNLAIHQATNNVWVTWRLANAVAELDGNAPGKVLRVITGIDSPNGIAIWQAKDRAYVTNREKGTLTEIDLKTARVLDVFSVVPPGTPITRRPLPFGVGVDENYGDVYVANYGAGSIAFFDGQKRVITTRTWADAPTHIEFSAAGKVSWILSGSGTVRAIIRNDPGRTYEVGKGAFDIAVAAHGQGGWVTNPDTQRVSTWGDMTKDQIVLENAPYAIADLGHCLGVVVPAEDALYILDYGLQKVKLVHQLPKQGVGEGGQGLVYNPKLDLAYVAAFADDSVTFIGDPCVVELD